MNPTPVAVEVFALTGITLAAWHDQLTSGEVSA